MDFFEKGSKTLEITLELNIFLEKVLWNILTYTRAKWTFLSRDLWNVKQVCDFLPHDISPYDISPHETFPLHPDPNHNHNPNPNPNRGSNLSQDKKVWDELSLDEFSGSYDVTQK